VKTRNALAVIALIASLNADVHALNPPSDSDGPIRLLNCVVSSGGRLEAEVDSQSDDALLCNFRCNYEFGGKTLSQWFEAKVPAHFSGRVGKVDTSGGKPGNYSGEVGTCRKIDARAVESR